MDRTILHCDLNAFYASVECLIKPELNNVPMAVCGSVENRHGIILAKNELAKKKGIITAETVWEAKRKCPDLVLVEPHFNLYNKYSKLVNEIYNRFTDMIEPFGIDESWLDVTGSIHLFGNGEKIANKIRETVKKELGLTISVGVSFNKIFAKLGSDYKKPDATTIISKDNYKDIVYPLPVSNLLYAGKKITIALSNLGIKTIGDLANADKGHLIKRLGKFGAMLHDYANGIDNSPIIYNEEHIFKSMGNGLTFKRNLLGISDIIKGVSILSDKVASRLRKSNYKCNGIQVTIRDPYFKTITRQKKLNTSTNISSDIMSISINIIKEVWDLDKPIRMITITAINLESSNNYEQLNIFESDNKRERNEKIERTIDNIRKKYGYKSITKGTNINIEDIIDY
jgi:DNA polymerase-4